MPRGFPALAMALLFSACAVLPAPVPMQSVSYDLPRGRAQCLLVLLPGVKDTAEDFERHGFIDELRHRPLSVDALAVNATLGYYLKPTFADRLQSDVLTPAIMRRYRHVWVAGVSMGGFGSLFYNVRKPGQVEGVLALAPWLGDDLLLQEIRRAGGMTKWSSTPSTEADEHEFPRQLWRWMQAVTSGSEKGPDLYLGRGEDDPWVAGADSMLAAGLSPSHVSTAPGGHDWPVWRLLFASFLDHSDFRRRCALH